ncbi:monocarboxylate transporter 6-like [Astyanax mexicanus]|uniref:Monocarboxylate transporter 6-like n=1 Tax=Astyanax mexicanus TaxID=7994 RepID=A0A8T2L0B5_ASTMX|nr:monocarboxylate transporter 6-like [Astyanax mexicanus]
MTEGVEAPQGQRATLNSRSNDHQARSSPNASDSWPELVQKGSCEPEEQDDQEEERCSQSEELQDPAEGAVERRSGQQLATDGQWGWVVLAATVLVLALTLAFPSCIGIFYTDLQNEFQSSNTETSWVPAIMTAVLHAGGPVCSALVECYGCRATIMVGGILSGLGMVASSFAQTMMDLYVGAGIITGLGSCLCFQPSVTMVGHYFVRRRAFANALSSTGTALGLSTLPLLANFLLGRFGWRGSFLVLGGVLLNCCVCGAVMRPLATTPKPKTVPVQLPSQATGLYIQREGLKGRLQSGVSGIMPFLRRHVAFDLMRTHPRFRAYAVGVTWMMLGFVVPLVYLVPYAIAQGLDQDQAALLMSILGLVNISVRPAAALVFGLPPFRGSRRFVYVFSGALLLNGLSNCICGVATSFNMLLAYVLTFAASMSIVGTLLFTVLMETVEMSRFPPALGLISVMESITLLLGPPLAGVLVDCTGHYGYVFFACSVSVSTAALFIMVSFYWLDRQSDTEEKKKKKMSLSPEETESLKPSINIAADGENCQVPLKRTSIQDSDTVTDV